MMEFKKSSLAIDLVKDYHQWMLKLSGKMLSWKQMVSESSSIKLLQMSHDPQKEKVTWYGES